MEKSTTSDVDAAKKQKLKAIADTLPTARLPLSNISFLKKDIGMNSFGILSIGLPMIDIRLVLTLSISSITRILLNRMLKHLCEIGLERNLWNI